MNRRTALKTLAAGAALPLAGLAADSQPSTLNAQPTKRAGFRLGVASISLKSLPPENMLAMLNRLGVDGLSLHRSHSPWESTPEAWRAIAAKIRGAGVTPRCCGVLYLKNDEQEARRMMEYVRALGTPLFSCSLDTAALPLLEKLVKEYDLRAAIHNHGPEDAHWATAKSVWEAVQPFDARIGLCIDVGHSYRAGENPAEIMHRYRARLYDVHIKDSLAAVGQKDVPVEMGRGLIDLPAVLTALIEADYRENVWLEYEKDPNDPVAGLAESLGYLRGVLRGLKAT